ncbi:MAG: peptide-methionine (R)-S-oxide reductase MsrB [Vicinamibacterales bacterium]
MESRRQFLTFAATALGLGPVVYWLSGPAVANRTASTGVTRAFPVEKSDAEWRAALTAEQYYVLRGHGTERPGGNALNKEKRRGTFSCVGCGNPLFDSHTKYESGTGWPSFYRPLDHAVATTVDSSFFMVRTEVHCVRCGGHLGHLFDDGPRPTGLRYCMNGAAMTFRPEA